MNGSCRSEGRSVLVDVNVHSAGYVIAKEVVSKEYSLQASFPGKPSFLQVGIEQSISRLTNLNSTRQTPR